MQPQPEAEYLVMLTHLGLQGYLGVPKFIFYSSQVQLQLERTRGLVGYRVGGAPLRNQYWTLSVWENESALMAFVRTEPHVSSMNAFKMAATHFTRWKIKGAEFPPSWDDAIRRGKETLNG